MGLSVHLSVRGVTLLAVAIMPDAEEPAEVETGGSVGLGFTTQTWDPNADQDLRREYG